MWTTTTVEEMMTEGEEAAMERGAFAFGSLSGSGGGSRDHAIKLWTVV